MPFGIIVEIGVDIVTSRKLFPDPPGPGGQCLVGVGSSVVISVKAHIGPFCGQQPRMIRQHVVDAEGGPKSPQNVRKPFQRTTPYYETSTGPSKAWWRIFKKRRQTLGIRMPARRAAAPGWALGYPEVPMRQAGFWAGLGIIFRFSHPEK